MIGLEYQQLVLDLFAGAGGWDVALERLDQEAHGVENMAAAVQTREAAGLQTVHGDVWTMDMRETPYYEGQVGSPPCPPFSAASNGPAAENLAKVLLIIGQGDWMRLDRLKAISEQMTDKRVALTLVPLHYWWHGQPEWVAWEQVPAVLPVWEACAEVMRDAGYNVVTGHLQAEMYGVPQTRKRAFLMAHREMLIELPEPTHSRFYPRNKTRLDPGVLPWVSMADALGWGLEDRPAPTITGGGIDTGGAEPITHLARYVDKPGWCWERPAPTIVGSFRPEVVAAPGWRTTVSRQDQPNSARITVAEAGVLQSFPVDWPWRGAKGKQYLQAGNAVPPLLAEAVLRQLIGE